MSREAAAADMCRLGCLTLEEQSSARANVPTERATTRNWSVCRSVRPCAGVHTSVSSSASLSSDSVSLSSVTVHLPRMCVAGRVSTCRERNSSRCFAWCRCLGASPSVPGELEDKMPRSVWEAECIGFERSHQSLCLTRVTAWTR
ncbi:hypothetical protein MSG28_006789 [Choristoneura fumiferana]|uniref:Uncharacterized protein n=1 Tax=Choristoneura fumiferana TaxID=7141 RepID=A0ACC0JL41_CHOFU|nr:hypothetical protein MSG28_006789 [Choristoneura fumiferana]